MMQKAINGALLLVVLFVGTLLVGCQAAPEAEKVAATPPPAPEAKAVAAKPISKPAAKPEKTTKPKPTPVKVARRDDAGMLTVNKLVHDFGKIEPKAKVKGEYILTNTGKETLEIEKVGKSCGCTVPELETKILEPGQSVPLKITYTAPDRPGKINKKVWVTIKAPHMPEKLTMTLTADVVQFIEATPTKLNLLISDKPQTQKLVLESIDGQPFHVRSFSCSGSSINVLFDREAKAVRHELTLEINSAKLRKSPRGNLTIQLNHPKVKTVTVGFLATKPFVAKPATKFFRNLKPGSKSEATITVVSNSSAPFELGELTSNKGLIQVLGTEKTPGGYKIQISLNVPEDNASGRVQDILNIPIKDHPDDTITVTCYGRVK